MNTRGNPRNKNKLHRQSHPSLFSNIKSQVTAFIVVGIVILAIFWVATTYSTYFSDRGSRIESTIEDQLILESTTIKENIDSCVRSVTDKGVSYISSRGFYLDIPFKNIYDQNYAHWIINTVNVMPDELSKIEDDMSRFVSDNIPSCVAFSDFRDNGWSISRFSPNAKVTISENDLLVEVDYSVDVKKEDFERRFTKSIYNPNIRFKNMYEKSVDFVNTQLLKPNLDFNDPLEGYDTSGYIIRHQKLDDKTLLFTISDPSSKLLDSSSFSLRFAARFDENPFPRTYDVSNSFMLRNLYTPDRLGILSLMSEVIPSSKNIT